MFQSAGGLQSLLKEGSRHYSGLEEAMLKNIDACKQLSTITRTSLGPHGMNKMVINAHEKLFVTSDAATILKELEVVHPAAKLLVLAAKMQESEVGDGTNLVVVLAGELLKLAEELVQTGLHPSDILSGYEKAAKKAEASLPDLTIYTVADTHDKAEVTKVLTPVLASKIYGYESHLASVVTEACLAVTENACPFDLDNVRVAKLLGGSLPQSSVVRGLVLTRGAEGMVTRAINCKVAVFNNPLDPQYSDTKGTVLITKAEQLTSYNKSEEDVAKRLIDELVEAGVKVVIAGASVSEMCMHFLELSQIMVVKVPSKFELRRVCKALKAVPLVRLGAPTAEEMGLADEISVQEIASHKVVILRRDTEASKVATIVLRASTQNLLDDAERAADDAINAFRMMKRDGRYVVGAGGSEAMLARTIREYGSTEPGLDQYAIMKFAQALEVVPKTLAENAGLNANDLLARLYAENSASSGIDIEEGTVKDMKGLVMDHLESKVWALRLASEAALTVLKVDQIIMAKPSGGPKPPEQKPQEDD